MSATSVGMVFLVAGVVYFIVLTALPGLRGRGDQYSRHTGGATAEPVHQPPLLGPAILRLFGARFRASVDHGPGFDWNAFADREVALFLTGLGVGLIVFRFPPGLLVGVLVPLIAWVMARRRAAAYRRQFAEQLPNALLLISSALSTGRNFANALQATVPNLSDPIRTELERLAVQTQMAGMTDAQAFRRWSEPLPYPDLRTIAATLEIGARVGLSTEVLLRSLSESMEGQIMARQELEALTSQVRATATVISLLPAAFVALIYLITPHFVEPLFTTPTGLVLIGIAVVMYFLSRFISAGILARIDVNPSGSQSQADSLVRLTRYGRVMPASGIVTAGLERREMGDTLEAAGLSQRLNIKDLARLKQVLALLLLVLGAVLAWAAGSLALFLLLGLGGAALGFILPDQQVAQVATLRQKRISIALPLALEVIGLTAERTSVDAAIAYYCEFFGDEVLAEEMKVALQRTEQLKLPLDNSLGELLRRNHNDDLSFLVAAVSQATRVGGGDLRQLLFEQARQLRNKQALGVKARALRAPVMMTFPTMFNMLTLLILLGGLAYLQIPRGH